MILFEKFAYGRGRLPIPDDLKENHARILDSWAASNYIEVVGRELGLTEEGKGAIVIGQTFGELVALPATFPCVVVLLVGAPARRLAFRTATFGSPLVGVLAFVA